MREETRAQETKKSARDLLSKQFGASFLFWSPVNLETYLKFFHIEFTLKLFKYCA